MGMDIDPKGITGKLRQRISALLATSSLCLPAIAIAQITATDPSVVVHNAPNNVPVVDIAAPNAAGLSHNRYTDFNVDGRGVVLNNGTADIANRQSQLAGTVAANANLGATSAKVILNEVTSTNRSMINGFTEVLGGKADVVIANPNGITCGGCGFVNAPNVTLTTGRPTIGADGQLNSFQVTGGDILITGSGFNATAQDYLALVARRIQLQAPVNANAIDIVGGSGDWNMLTRAASARVAADTPPLYVIDSSALGGVYAGRVRLIVTEAGAGVRMAGDMAANAGDFTINAAGRVELSAALSASGALSAQSSGDGFALNGARLTSGGSLALSATSGAIALAGGTLVAGTTLTLSGASFSDSPLASSLTDANKRYGAAGVTLAFTGRAAIGGTVWGSAGSLGFSGASLTADNASLSGNTLDLRATAGDMALGSTALKTPGTLSLTAKGQLSTSGTIQSTDSDVALSAQSVAASGTVSANNGALTVTGSLVNDGVLQAKSAVTLAGGSYLNRNTINGLTGVSINGVTLTNAGTINGQFLSVIASGSLVNSGTIASQRSANISVASFANSGSVQASSSLTLAAGGVSSNSGQIIASTSIALTSLGSGLSLTNSAQGLVQAGTLSIASGNGAAAVTLANLGRLLADTATLQLGLLTNTGQILTTADLAIDGVGATAGITSSTGAATIQAEGAVRIGSGGTFASVDLQGGKLYAGGELDITATALSNRGEINAGLSRIIAGAMTNSGLLTLTRTGAATSILSLSSLTNSGTLQASGGLALDISTTLENHKDILLNGDLAIRATGAALSINNGTDATAIADQAATMQASGVLSISTLNNATATITNNVGVVSGNGLNLTLAGLTSSGKIQSLGTGRITASGVITNRGTLYTTNGLSLTAGTLNNSGSIQGTTGTIIGVNGVTNTGSIVLSADGSGGSIIADTIDTSNIIQSAGAASFTANNLTNSGSIVATGALNFLAGSSGLSVNNAGTNATLQSGTTLSIGPASGVSAATFSSGVGALVNAPTLALNLATFNNLGAIQTTSAFGLTTSSTATNNGTLLTAGTARISAQDLSNGGTFEARGATTLTVNGTLTNAGTMNFANGSSSSQSLTAQTIINATNALLNAQGSLTLTGSTIDNSGIVLSGADLTLQGRSGGTSFTLTNRAAGGIASTGMLTIGTNGVRSYLRTFAASQLIGGTGATLWARTINDAGLIQASGNLMVTADALNVRSTGTLLAMGKLNATLTSDFTVDQNGAVQASSTTLSAGMLQNSGTVTLGTSGTDTSHLALSQLTNARTGTIQSAGTISLQLDRSLTNSGNIVGAAAVNFDQVGSNFSFALNGGTFQMGDDFRLNASTLTFTLGQGATIAAKSFDLNLKGLNSSGSMQATGDINVTVSNDLTMNGGAALYAGGRANLTAQNITIKSNAGIEGVKGLTQTAASSFYNEGLVTAGTAATAALGTNKITAATFTNMGTLAATKSQTLIVANTLTNNSASGSAGMISSGGDITVTNGGIGTLALSNSGTFYAGGTLSLQSSAGNLMALDSQTGVMRADVLKLAFDTLTNDGILQGDSTGTIAITDGLINTAATNVIYLGSAAGTSATISYGSLNNGGSIQSQGNLTLTANGNMTIQSGGQIVAGGNLTMIAGAATAYDIRNLGTIQTAGVLNMGTAAARFRNIFVGESGQPTGGTIRAGSGSSYQLTLAIYPNAIFNSTGSFIINSSGGVVMPDTSSAIVLGDISSITTPTVLTNNGALYSTGDLTISANSINNNKSGGIAALGSLGITANTGNIGNYGSVFGGNVSLTAPSAGATITNYSPDSAGTSGQVTANNNLTITAPTIVNNYLISVTGTSGELKLVGTTVRNEVTGGDTRSVNYAGTNFDPDNSSDKTAAYGNGADAYTDTGNHSAALANTWRQTSQSNADGSVISYTATFQTSTAYANNATPQFKPQLLSNGRLTISATDANNLGGVISGNQVTINATSFNNDALAVGTQNWKATWQTTYSNNGFNATPYVNYTKSITSQTGSSVGASITGNSGTITVGTFTNNGKTTTTMTTPSANPTGARSVQTPAAPTSNAAGYGAGSSAMGATGTVATSNTFALTAPISGGAVTGSAVTLGTTGPVSGGTVFSGGPTQSTVAPSQPAKVALAPLSVVTTPAGAALQFENVSIPLPTSPNALFVIATAPSAKYLIETNPLFTGIGGSSGTSTGGSSGTSSGGGAGTNTGGGATSSDTIAQQLGLNVTRIERRLGDAAYESFLITQQVVAQTGVAALNTAESSNQQSARLMGQAVSAARAMGLVYGLALTDAQIGGLQQDIVWMVETEVKGVKVLAPVVYLSAKTKSMFDAGDAVVAAKKLQMNVGTLTNTGGTISGAQALNIVATGDIKNVSGNITGGNLALRSTGGSIINRTNVIGTTNTLVEKAASISATGTLSLQAVKDITTLGATVNAGGDASLQAGGAITFGTIDNKSFVRTLLSNGEQTTTTVQQIGSGLAVGGNLKLASGGDTTFQASQVKVGGNADITTGGDLNVLAGQNSVATNGTTKTEGYGVGGGLYGKSTTTTDTFSGRNVASNLSIGGDFKVASAGAATIQGSNVAVGGDADVRADSIKILQGNDIDRSTTVTTTDTFLRLNSGDSTTANTSVAASASAKGALAQAGANAAASTGNTAKGDLEFSNTTTITNTSDKSVAVGSSFTVGGNTRIAANKDVTLQGSTLAGKGDVQVDARDINILAAQSHDIQSTTTESTSVGLMAASANSADANAGAKASSSLTSQASANAGANAASDNTVDLVRTSKTTTTNTNITNGGSRITSGGNTALTAANALNVQGSSVDSKGDLALAATTQNFTAVNDVHETRTDRSQTNVGVYASANANANANAQIGALGGRADAGVGTEGGIGANVTHTSASSVNGSTTAITSSITSGGNLTRTATGTIIDEGTTIAAGKDFTQNAGTYVSKAAQDTTYSSSTNQSDNARLGVYAGANAGATTGVGAGGATGAGASASIGVKASYTHQDATDRSDTTTARVSTITVGGNTSLTSAGNTSLEGTQINGAKNVALTAGSLDYTAAKNTQTSSSSSTSADATLKVGVDATKAARAELNGSYQGSQSESAASQAVVGGISSGGNLTVKTTQGDANFQGTKLAASGNASIDSSGSVNMTAARDTNYTKTNNQNAAVGFSTEKSARGGIDAAGGFTHEMENSTTARAGSVTGGGTVSINAAKNVALEGTTTVGSAGTSISAGPGGSVTRTAAVDTHEVEAYGADLAFSAEKGKNERGAPAPLSRLGTNAAVDVPAARLTSAPAATKTTAARPTAVSVGNAGQTTRPLPVSASETTTPARTASTPDAPAVPAPPPLRQAPTIMAKTDAATAAGNALAPLTASSSAPARTTPATAGTAAPADNGALPPRQAATPMGLAADIAKPSNAARVSAISTPAGPSAELTEVAHPAATAIAPHAGSTKSPRSTEAIATKPIYSADYTGTGSQTIASIAANKPAKPPRPEAINTTGPNDAITSGNQSPQIPALVPTPASTPSKSAPAAPATATTTAVARPDAKAEVSPLANIPRPVTEAQSKLEDISERLKQGIITPDQATAERKVVAEPVLREMLSRAEDAKKEADTLAGSLAKEFGGKLAAAPPKSEKRAMEKILGDYAGDASQIKDLARNTIVVDPGNIASVVAKLREAGATVKLVKNEGEADKTDPTYTTRIDTLGYTGVNAVITTKSGLTAEIQVNSAKMIYAKEKRDDAIAVLGEPTYNAIAKETGQPSGLGHTLYEEWRQLQPDSEEAKGIAAKSRAYYSHFQPIGDEAVSTKPASAVKAEAPSAAAERSERRLSNRSYAPDIRF